ncbi:MAG: Prolyl endopeptidase [Myxococcota bacterium]|nr:Prolyl endopeptidase [Myxococcota bacterium]
MKKRWAAAIAVLLFAACAARVPPSASRENMNRLQYPVAGKVDVVDDYHGEKIADPYRWLEDPDNPAAREWIEAENRLTRGFIDAVAERPKIRESIESLWNYERFSAPVRRGGRYFFQHNTGLQNQSVLKWKETLSASGAVLLDPNTLSADGTVALTGFAPSPDGKLLAYGIASGGSDWNEWRVREVDTGRDLGDRLRWVKFSGAAWKRDGSGFFYGRYPEPPQGKELLQVNTGQQIWFHRTGDPQEKDQLVYERKDHPDWMYGHVVSEDGRFLVLHIVKGTDDRCMVAVIDLTRPDARPIELISSFDHEFSFIGAQGRMMWFRTNHNAPRYRVVGIDLDKPDPASWKEIIPQTGDIISDVNFVGGRFAVNAMHNAHSRVILYAPDGQRLKELELPGIGTAMGFGGESDHTETFYSFTTFTRPATIYRYDFTSDRSEILMEPETPFDPAEFETVQIFFKSRDGERVPMFVTYRKGLKLDGLNPTYMYGYGGFSVSLTPWYSVKAMAWMRMGGVYVVVNLRGGGEFGKEWHDAGRLHNKQNVFNDFIAAAEWLIGYRFTRPGKLAIAGGSNGGLLVGACVTQRPDLFGAGVAAVGVMDMLRYDRFTIGWAWRDDYGSSSDPAYFRTLRAYSPYHNIRKGTAYPAMLITTADHDDRVAPSHSFKFAAAMQEAQAGDAPVLIRIETRAGHGAGKPTNKLIEEGADELAFLHRVLDFPGTEAARAPSGKE